MQKSTKFFQCANIDATEIKHAFFTRNGGVSQGLYKSLNVSFSSNDLAENVIANRQLIIDEFSANCQLITLHQQHSDAGLGPGRTSQYTTLLVMPDTVPQQESSPLSGMPKAFRSSFDTCP